MFEIIMLLGFLYAATSQLRSEESDNSKEDSESLLLVMTPDRTKTHQNKNSRKRKGPKSNRNIYMRAA